MPTKYFEDLTVGETSTFGSREVTREEVIEFATKYDPQPFHIDEEAAKNSVFGALCASGWHTCAMMMSMLVENMSETKLASMGSPGLDKLQWLKPVFPGDTLSLRSTVTEKRESKSRPNIGLVKMQQQVLNQKGEIVADLISNAMIVRKPV